MDGELDLLGAGLRPEPVIGAAAVVAGVVARGLGEPQHRGAASRLLHSCASWQLPVSSAPAQLRGGAAAKIFVNTLKNIFVCSSHLPASTEQVMVAGSPSVTTSTDPAGDSVTTGFTENIMDLTILDTS